MKLIEQLSKIKNMMGLNEDMTPDEEQQMCFDIVSMDPDNPKYQKYKEILKQKFNVDFDAQYGEQDPKHLQDIDPNNVKSKKDFMDFNNWLKYAKQVSEKRGFIPMTQYDTPGEINADEILNKLSKELGFNIVKKDYVETNRAGGDIAHVMGTTLYYTPHTDLYYIAHELGHICDFKMQYEGIAKNPAYSPTSYGTSNPGETFAENFAIYFINPHALQTWNQDVYNEMGQKIPGNWKSAISQLFRSVYSFHE